MINRVLLVDDDYDNLRSMNFYLKKLGAQVFPAVDGAVGLEVFGREDINIVISDISMPKVDGLEMAQKIRELNSDVPMIAISGHHSIYRDRAIEAGFNEYLPKPFVMEELFDALRRVMLNYRD